MTVSIQTNHQARDVLYWYELTAKEQSEFEYLDTDDKQSEAQFMRYRGAVYDLGEFMRVETLHPFPFKHTRWDGYASDTFFSGVLIRYVDHFERVVVGTYYS